jgi:FAD:protein FMN transferase
MAFFAHNPGGISMAVLLDIPTSFLAGVLLAGPAQDAEPLFQQARPAMGTSCHVYLHARDAAAAEALFEAAFAEIERVEEMLSAYRPTSELSRINAHAARSPVTTDPETFALLGRALDFAARSQGAFDITVGRLVEAWGFFSGDKRRPTPAELEAARRETGWRQMALDPAARTVVFRVPGLRLDLGGLGKGYALDQAARVLRGSGVTAALIEAGTSSYVAIGAPPGEAGWPIRIPDPLDRTQTLSTVRIRDASLSTSGSYEKYFELEGRRYSHIIDPRDGEPVEGMVQVTARAESAFDSDVLSTALFVLGPEQGAALLASVPGGEALLVGEGSEPSAVVALDWKGPVAATRGVPPKPRGSRP